MAKILCIEDEADIRSDIVEELQDAGYATLEAADGLQGLETIRKHHPDLVLCDITMPKMDGHLLLKEVRENHAQFAELPFLFLTALADRSNILAGLDLGADDYLTKPIDYELLLARIKARLREVGRIRERKQEEQVRLYRALTGGDALPAGPDSRPTQPPASPAEAIPAPSAPAPPAKAKDVPAALELKLREIMDRAGAGSAGRLHFINLAEIKKVLGDDWQRVSDKALLISESVIKQHMSKTSSYDRYGTDAFFILFPELDEEEALFAVQCIANEICTRLLGEDYRTYRNLSIAADASKIKEMLGDDAAVSVAALAAAFDKKSEAHPPDKRHTLVSHILDQISLKFQPVWNRKQERIIAYHAAPLWTTNYGRASGADMLEEGEEHQILTEIDMMIATRIAGYLQPALLRQQRIKVSFPVHYSSLAGGKREKLAAALERVGTEQLASHLMVELISVPDDVSAAALREAIACLRAYCGAVMVRVTPQRPPAKLCREAGAAFLSRKFDDGMSHGDMDAVFRELQAFAKETGALGLIPYLHSVDTMGGVKAGIAAGLPLIAGRAIAREQDRPGESYLIQKDRFLIA